MREEKNVVFTSNSNYKKKPRILLYYTYHYWAFIYHL